MEKQKLIKLFEVNDDLSLKIEKLKRKSAKLKAKKNRDFKVFFCSTLCILVFLLFLVNITSMNKPTLTIIAFGIFICAVITVLMIEFQFNQNIERIITIMKKTLNKREKILREVQALNTTINNQNGFEKIKNMDESELNNLDERTFNAFISEKEKYLNKIAPLTRKEMVNKLISREKNINFNTIKNE